MLTATAAGLRPEEAAETAAVAAGKVGIGFRACQSLLKFHGLMICSKPLCEPRYA